MIKLYRFIRPFGLHIIIIFVLVFSQVISELYLPTLISSMVDLGIVKKNIGFIFGTGMNMLMITAFGTICAIISSLLVSRTSANIGEAMRNQVFSKVEQLSLNEFDSLGTSTIITRTTNDITQIQQVIGMVFNIIVSAPLMCIGGIIMAMQRDRVLTSIIVVIIIIATCFIGLLAKQGIPIFKQMQEKLDKINLVFRENLKGIRVIRAFNRIDSEQIRFEKASTEYKNIAIKVNRLMAILMPMMMLFMNITTVALIWFGAIRINNGSLHIGELMAFIQYAMLIISSFAMVSMMFVIVPRASASAIRINEILDSSSEVSDKDNTTNLENLKGEIEFKNVSFSYRGAEQAAISDISFVAKPGEVTALIGGIGSGKSTVVNLIPRFYEVVQGSILIDGVDTKEINKESFRGKIGYVPQKTVLFPGTIIDNIRYGNQHATVEEVKHALEVAQATEFIMKTEDGLEHFISQEGNNLSGGQKQRLSIARAVVRKPKVYIFDDCFAALDYRTEFRIRDSLKNEISSSTVIIVAQRVASIIDADKIIVLDEGKIKGVGTHKELLKTCVTYREIVSSQLSTEVSA